MHRAKSRALQRSQGHRWGAVALLIFAPALLWLGLEPQAATPPLASPEQTGSLPLPEAAYEHRVFKADPGKEGFELAARLKEHGDLIARPISWRIYRLVTAPELGGELIHEAHAPIAALSAASGDYRIEIEYGLARFSRYVTLDPGQRLALVFNLNMGGLRVLSRLAAPPPVTFRTSHRIYALFGSSRMRLIAENAVPGDLLRLPAGRYRIESQLAPGNAVARSDIEVRPGVLSAVEIDHKAGVATLALEGAAPQTVSWQILDRSGRLAATAHGTRSHVILSPGQYQVEVNFGAATLSRPIAIEPGRRLDVTFP